LAHQDPSVSLWRIRYYLVCCRYSGLYLLETAWTTTCFGESSPGYCTNHSVGYSGSFFFFPRYVFSNLHQYLATFVDVHADWSSSRVMASIKTMLPDDCIVIRDGIQKSISTTELVPGDLIRISGGNKLPADIRLVQVSSDVKFDRSILTGTFTDGYRVIYPY
jgi:cation transport ATPase